MQIQPKASSNGIDVIHVSSNNDQSIQKYITNVRHMSEKRLPEFMISG